MRLISLIALLLALGALAVIGFLHLVRDLLVKEFFHPPSLPGE